MCAIRLPFMLFSILSVGSTRYWQIQSTKWRDGGVELVSVKWFFMRTLSDEFKNGEASSGKNTQEIQHIL